MDTLQKRIYESMTPEQKLRIVSDLRSMAWDLKAAWIRGQHPQTGSPHR